MFKDIAKKAAIAAMMAATTFGAAHASTQAPTYDGNEQVSISVSKGVNVSLGELTSIIEKTQKIDTSDIIPNDIKIKYTVLDKEMIDSGYAGGDAVVDLAAQNCSISVPIDKEMGSSFLGTRANREYFKDYVSPTNYEQGFLRTAFATYHEASHCKFYNMEKPFLAENTQVQDNLNDYFRFAGKHTNEAGHVFAGYYEILNENYADTRGAMELIKKHGSGHDVIAVLEKARLERAESVATTSQTGFDAHSSMYSLEEVLKPEMVEKIKQSNPVELDKMALEIANRGAVKVVATYGNVDEIISNTSIMTGTSRLALVMYGNEIEQSTATPNVNLHFDSNKLYTAAEGAVKELKAANLFTGIKTQEDLNDLFKKNQLQIENEALNSANQVFGPEFDKNNDVVGSVANYFKEAQVGEKQNVKSIQKEAMSMSKKFDEIEGKLKVSQQETPVDLPKPKFN